MNSIAVEIIVFTVVPKSSRGWKWKNLLRRIWKDKSQYEGQGIGTTVVIPSDPDALLDDWTSF